VKLTRLHGQAEQAVSCKAKTVGFKAKAKNSGLKDKAEA